MELENKNLDVREGPTSEIDSKQLSSNRFLPRNAL